MKKTITWFVGFLVTVLLGVAVVVIVKGRENQGQTVENGTKDFSFLLPSTWYLERNDASGATIYPDYSESGNSEPTCKIEISSVGSLAANASQADLNDWVGQYIHKDSMSDILEISRSAPDISGAVAVEWRGIMNGATTTLVYAASQGKIFEIAPSTMISGSEADNEDCLPALKEFLPTLQF